MKSHTKLKFQTPFPLMVFPFSFPLSLFLMLCVFFLALISFLNKSPSSSLNKSLRQLSQHPISPKNHLQLAHLYLNSGDKQSAKQELVLALETISKQNNQLQVLGETTDTRALLDEIENIPIQEQKNRYFWEQIVMKYPNYRDGWIQLLYLSYNAGDLNKLKYYLAKINTLDPNFSNELPEELKTP